MANLAQRLLSDLPNSTESWCAVSDASTQLLFLLSPCWSSNQNCVLVALPASPKFPLSLTVLSPNILLALWIYFSISSSKGYGLIQTHVSQKQHRESSNCDVNPFSREAKLYLLNVAWRFQGILRVLNAYYHMHGISPFYSIKPLWMDI